MGLDTLKEALPDYAKDLKLNLGSVTRDSSLNEQQLWGTVLACAAATRIESVVTELSAEAKGHLTDTAYSAALGAASIMGMNNVLYRARHFLEGAYDSLPAGLRMQIIGGSGGVDKVDFELWAFAVSTINGCQACVASHEHVVREGGLSQKQVLDALRVAATIAGVAQAIFIAETLG